MAIGSAEFLLSADNAKLLQDLSKAEQATKRSAQEQAESIAKAHQASATSMKRASSQIAADQKRMADQAVQAFQRMEKAQQATSASSGGLAKSIAGVAVGYLSLNTALSAGVAVLSKIEAETQRANQSQFALTATFKSSAASYAEFATKQSEITKRSALEYQEAATAFGSLNKNYALGASQIQELLKRSADLAAVNGITVTEAAQRLEAALRGEAEAAEFLGLTLNSDYLKKFSDMSAEQRKNWETLNPLIKAQITYREVLKQTDPVLGAAAKRANDQAGAWDRMKKAQSDLAVSLGTKLKPELSATAQGVEKVVQWLDQAITKTVEWKRTVESIGQGPIQVGPDPGLPGSFPGPTPAQAAAAEEGRAELARIQAQREEDTKRALERQQRINDQLAESSIAAIDKERKAKERWYDEERTRIEARRTYQLADIEKRRDAALAGIQAEADAAKAASEEAIAQAERRKAAELAAVDEAADQVKRVIDAEKDRLDTVRELEDRDREDRRRAEDQELTDTRAREDAEVAARRDALGKIRADEDRARADRRAKDDAERQQRRSDEDRNRADRREAEDRELAERRQREDRDLEGRKERELQDIATVHQQRIAAIEAEIAATRQQSEARQEALDAEAEAAQAAFDSEARERARVHEVALAGLEAEEKALRSRHDQLTDELEDEADLRRQQADEAVDGIERQKRAEDDRHRQAIRAIDAEGKRRLAAIDAELGLLDAADDADERTARDQALQDAIVNARLGVTRAESTGNYSEIVKARQELADAEAAIVSEGVKRERNAARSVLLARKDALREEIAAQKDAENERNRLREQELADARDAIREELELALNAIRARRESADDDLARDIEAIRTRREALVASYEAEREAAQLALEARLEEIEARGEALEEETETALALLASRKEAEQTAHEQALERINSEYAQAKQRLDDRRRDQDRDREDRRQKEDRDRTDRRAKEDAELAASRQAQDRKREDERKAEDQQLQEAATRVQMRRQGEDRALDDRRNREDRDREDRRTAEDKALATQLAAAVATQKAERDAVDAHYNGHPNGIIPQISAAMEKADAAYRERLRLAGEHFRAEREAAALVFDNPEKNGLLNLLEKARNDEIEKLNDSTEDWRQWQRDVSEAIKKAQGDLDAFIKSGAAPPGAGATPGVAGAGGAPGGPPGGPSGGAPGAPAGTDAVDLESWLREAMKKTGVGDDWFPGLRQLVKLENAPADPRARNPEPVFDANGRNLGHASGLLQTIPPTFAAFALPGMNDIWNPVHNAAAAIRYILKRYGHVNAAVQGHKERGGYDSGHLFRDPTMTINARTGERAWIAEKRPELLLSGAATARINEARDWGRPVRSASVIGPAPSWERFSRDGAGAGGPHAMLGGSGARERQAIVVQLGNQTLERIAITGLKLAVERGTTLADLGLTR